MPDLVLLRHGKSDWNAGGAGDRQRPLARRGVEAAQTMGRVIARVHRVPEVVLTSPAVRARTTAELAVAAGSWGCPIRVIDGFYGGGVGDVIDLLRRAPEVERLVAVGHEPTWSALAGALIGGGDIRMPTAAAVSIGVPSWSGLGRNTGELRWMLVPRLFTDAELAV